MNKDTIDTNEPVGAEGATSSQDTSIDDTQAVDESQESIDGTSDAEIVDSGSETEKAPKLLAGKYENQDELVKAYQELEGKLGEQGQKAELVNLIEKQTGMSHQQIKDYLANQAQQQMMQQQQENPVGYLMQRQQELESRLALQNEEKELDKFLSSEEGKPYTKFKDKILKLGLNLERDKPYNEIAKEYFGESRAQGQQDAYRKIETKKNTQTTGASQSAPKGRVTLEDLDKMSVEEMEQVLPHADTSNRLY